MSGCRRRLPWDVQQYRGGGATVFRAEIDPRQHDDPTRRVHPEGQRQQQRDGRRRAEPGQDADDGAEEAAHQAPEDVDPELLVEQATAAKIVKRGRARLCDALVNRPIATILDTAS